MIENAEQRQPETGRPLSMRAIVLGGVLVGLVGAVAVAALLYFYGGGTDRDRAGLEVVRTAGTLVVGTGGAIALLLAARRQRSTELTLEHQREVAATAARDAVEQRITELYTRAVDQLGNDHAPVRLGGLHALERLAQRNPDQQQTIVDVICAYLRMPYTPPNDEAPAEDAPAEVHARYEQRRQELQVRLTAQRILATHLRRDRANDFWPGINLNLTEARLYELDLAYCHIKSAQFDGAHFGGTSLFDGAHFDGEARFRGAHFEGRAVFNKANFGRDALFDVAHFGEEALFEEANFDGETWFSAARFGSYALLRKAYFGGGAVFIDARFGGFALFDDAKFRGGDAYFNKAQFNGAATFNDAQFSGYAGFDEAKARSHFGHLWPEEWDTRDARSAEGEEEGWTYLIRVKDSTGS